MSGSGNGSIRRIFVWNVGLGKRCLFDGMLYRYKLIVNKSFPVYTYRQEGYEASVLLLSQRGFGVALFRARARGSVQLARSRFRLAVS
jgi:hypothetical protein